MSPTADRLYALLPAIYRVRDAEQGEPLKGLIAVLAEQVAVVEEDLAQLYDDQFIETCAPWVAPYLGDVIGYRALHGVVPRISSPRAEIANTIGYRRRKGTAAMLEQIARDVTGWDACVVEFFQRLATTQHMNHIRRANRSPDLRAWEPLERLDTPFDSLAHTADVRRIVPGRGKHNIPNIGIYLWRVLSLPRTRAQPFKVDDRHYRFDPLGIDQPLFTRPETKEEFAGRSTRMNVPEPINRRLFAEYLTDYYGEEKSVVVSVDGKVVDVDQVAGADLSDGAGGAWAAAASEKILIDPVLGRIAFPAGAMVPMDVRVTYHYGFSAEMGGGEYDRSDSIPDEFTGRNVWQIGVSAERAPIKDEQVTTLVDAVIAWNAQPAGTVGVIALMDNVSYVGDVDITLGDGSRLLIVAADWPVVTQPDGSRARVAGRFTAANYRPHLRGNLTVAASGSQGGALALNGLLMEGALEIAEGELQQLSLGHCTLVPGRGFTQEGYPLAPRDPSVTVRASSGVVRIENCITGGIRFPVEVSAAIENSMVDGTSRCGVALSGVDGYGPCGTLRIANSTVVGKVHTELMELATNTIFFSRRAVNDYWPAPVLCTRRQQGCVRFSYVPLDSRTPRRYRCQPADEDDVARVAPLFNSLRFGEPGYAQLSEHTAAEIFSGADDESEMGVFHDLFEPQRIANVRVRLDEYLRFGLEAGIFFEPRLASRPIVPNAYTYQPWVDLCGDAGAEPLPGIGAGLI
ncbi:MAG: hypothetical protein ABIZ04_21810 [Opitutus sp.]